MKYWLLVLGICITGCMSAPQPTQTIRVGLSYDPDKKQIEWSECVPLSSKPAELTFARGDLVCVWIKDIDEGAILEYSWNRDSATNTGKRHPFVIDEFRTPTPMTIRKSEANPDIQGILWLHIIPSNKSDAGDA